MSNVIGMLVMLVPRFYNVGHVHKHHCSHMSGSDEKPHVQLHALYILDKVQRSKSDTVVNPTKYFRGVATLVQESFMCNVNFMFYLERNREKEKQADR